MLNKVSPIETTTTAIPAASAFAIDVGGDFWVNGSDDVGGVTTIRSEVRQFSPDGTQLGVYALPFPAARILSDGAGGAWIADRPGGQVARVAGDGTVGAALGVTASDFCIDAQQNLWVAGGPTLLKLAPDGTQLGSYPIQARTLTFGDGFVLAGTGSAPHSVLKIVP